VSWQNLSFYRNIRIVLQQVDAVEMIAHIGDWISFSKVFAKGRAIFGNICNSFS